MVRNWYVNIAPRFKKFFTLLSSPKYFLPYICRICILATNPYRAIISSGKFEFQSMVNMIEISGFINQYSLIIRSCTWWKLWQKSKYCYCFLLMRVKVQYLTCKLLSYNLDSIGIPWHIPGTTKSQLVTISHFHWFQNSQI